MRAVVALALSMLVATPAAGQKGKATVCERFADRLATLAGEHSGTPAFLQAVQKEFVAGTDDPFRLKEGLERGRWNPEYFYSGHGGFYDDLDDAERYPRGGNHQPGHWVAVLSIAARFGEPQARAAIAYAGDYEPDQEDDLRLSDHAIRLGGRLARGEATPSAAAAEARTLCR